MKKFTLLFIVLATLIACSKKQDAIQEKVQAISVNIKVDRFDKAFFETPIQDLPQLKRQYPAFFPTGVPDTVWTNKMKNQLWRELYGEVQKQFGDFKNQKQEINNLFQHIKYFYPKIKIPKVVTLIQEMDPEYKVIYADSLVLVSLELYLGKNHKFYEFPAYQKQGFEPAQMLPDMVEQFSLRKVKPPTQNDLLSLMVYSGKQLYLKDILLPDLSDEVKICYTPEQLQYCIENQSNMWRFFIEQNLLYNTNPKLAGQFINQAPFSKFGLVSDNDTPGRVGAWFGWQIVRAYMDNNKVNLQQMLAMDAKDIFQKSQYKPKK